MLMQPSFNEGLFSKEPEPELTFEGYQDFASFLTGAGDKISLLWRKITNEHVYAIETKPDYDKRAVEAVNARGYMAMEKFGVYIPQRVAGMVYELAQELETQLSLLLDIEKNLYDPVISYLAKASSWEDVMQKPWMSRDLKFNDLEAFRKDLKAFYKDDGDLRELRPFSEAYAKTAHVMLNYKLLDRIYMVVDRVDLVTIKEKEKRINEVIKFLVEEKGDELEQMSAKNKAKVRDTLLAIANETEYLVILLYEFNRLIVANNANMKRFKEELL